jgi:hypothetical protein
MKQIEEDQWDEIGGPEPVCELPFTVKQMSKTHGLTFFSYEEEGMGEVKAAVVELGKHKYWLLCPVGQNEIGVCVNIRSFEADSKKALMVLLDHLKLKLDDLPWSNEYLGPAQWQLTRVDDNNNEVEVYRFLNHDSARWVRDDYEEKGHKQDYYIHELE